MLADFAADFPGPCHQSIQRAKLGQPFHRRFLPAFRHTGDIVGFVADQGQPIGDALGRHAEFRHHAGRVQARVGHGVLQRHRVIDQLRHVFVAG